MKPASLQPGDAVSVTHIDWEVRRAFFVRHQSGKCGRRDYCYFRFPYFAGLDGPAEANPDSEPSSAKK
jgi:hypothetical protein